MVIVDTSVWVPFFRHRGSPEYREVDVLLERRQVVMVGAVMAEVLQGARTQREFAALRLRVTALPYLSETAQTWARVSDMTFRLRQRGITVGLVDLLIASLALEGDHALYTLDAHFQNVPGLKLHQPGDD